MKTIIGQVHILWIPNYTFWYYNVLVTFVRLYSAEADDQRRMDMAEKKVLIDWVKKHKKKLILAGASIPVILALIIGIKNRDELIKAWKALIKLADETSQKITDITTADWEDASALEIMDFNTPKNGADLIEVCLHIRNLPEGWTPSKEKIMSAAQMGYELKPSQTWVEKYTKRKFVA